MADQFHSWGVLLGLAQQHKTKLALREAIVASGLKLHDEEPWSGYYRCAAIKDGPLLPVAIWRDENGKLIILRNNIQMDRQRVWPHAVWTPIPHEWYEAYTERGEKWPDAADLVVVAEKPAEPKQSETAAPTTAEPAAQAATPETLPAAGASETKPEETEAERAKRVIEAHIATSAKITVVTSDEEAAAAQEARAKLNEVSNKADKRREKLKAPHWEECKKIDGEWNPSIKAAGAEAERIRVKVLKVWENVKFQREQAEIQRLAQEQADTAAAAAQAFAADPVPSADGEVTTQHNQPPVEQDTAPLSPPPPPPAILPANPSAGIIKGATGRAARVNTHNVAHITDYDALYAHIKAFPEIKTAMLKVAQRLVDNLVEGQTVPGVEVHQERDVA